MKSNRLFVVCAMACMLTFSCTSKKDKKSQSPRLKATAVSVEPCDQSACVTIRKEMLGKKLLLSPYMVTPVSSFGRLLLTPKHIGFVRQDQKVLLYEYPEPTLTYKKEELRKFQASFEILRETMREITFQWTYGTKGSFQFQHMFGALISPKSRDVQFEVMDANVHKVERLSNGTLYISQSARIKMENPQEIYVDPLLNEKKVSRILPAEISSVDFFFSIEDYKSEMKPLDPTSSLGIFVQTKDDGRVQSVARWDFRKEKGPIKLLLPSDATDRMLTEFHKGANYWNRAIGWEALVVQRGAWDETQIPLRSIGVRFLETSSKVAWGSGVPQADPLTGEIIRAEINVVANPEFIDQFHADFVAHEIGHALGFRHNFAASYYEGETLVSSVMDYDHAEDTAQIISELSQQTFEYDQAVIDYMMTGEKPDEIPRYCDDTDLSLAENYDILIYGCERRDLATNKPFTTAVKRVETADPILKGFYHTIDISSLIAGKKKVTDTDVKFDYIRISRDGSDFINYLKPEYSWSERKYPVAFDSWDSILSNAEDDLPGRLLKEVSDYQTSYNSMIESEIRDLGGWLKLFQIMSPGLKEDGTLRPPSLLPSLDALQKIVKSGKTPEGTEYEFTDEMSRKILEKYEKAIEGDDPAAGMENLLALDKNGYYIRPMYSDIFSKLILRKFKLIDYTITQNVSFKEQTLVLEDAPVDYSYELEQIKDSPIFKEYRSSVFSEAEGIIFERLKRVANKIGYTVDFKINSSSELLKHVEQLPSNFELAAFFRNHLDFLKFLSEGGHNPSMVWIHIDHEYSSQFSSLK